MATVKVKFRASSVEMKEGSLYYQVIHNRLVRQLIAEALGGEEGLHVIQRRGGVAHGNAEDIFVVDRSSAART